jgi:hypothetical protein
VGASKGENAMGNPRQAHTYVTLEVSVAAYNEIAAKLREAHYHHVFTDDGLIDMHEIALAKEGPRETGTPPAEQFNDFCRDAPCASATCRRAGKCLHPS